jgi:two-component system chemotaxis response regulator CheB
VSPRRRAKPQARQSLAKSDVHAGRPIIVIGASAGGIEALRTLTGALPADIPAAVFVVLHIGASSLSVLPTILSRASPLRVASATEGAPIRNGQIYVAPPDRHLLVQAQRVRVTRGPKEHHFRPAVDPLFRSAAAAHGSRVIGVILSGTLGDGALGLRAVKMAGGLAIVQDPRDALFDSMPLRALDVVQADHCVPVAQIGPLLAGLCRRPVTPLPIAPATETWTPTLFVCPDCGGVLSQQAEGPTLRFRCHVGHGFDGNSLLEAQDDSLEAALYTAARALAEKAGLLRQLGARARQAGRDIMADRFTREGSLYDGRRDSILRFLARGNVGRPEARPEGRKLLRLPARLK